MSEQRADLILEHLRAIRSDIGEIKTDLIEIKQRIGFLEGQYANLSSRVDPMVGDIALIKRRLDLVKA
jgi:DNA anti-recombination protein RmuC